MTRLLVIMGSAETTPTMIKPHRAIFARVGDRSAVILDTPYGFQENADDITARAVDYFARSVGRQVSVASYRTADPGPLAAETARAAVRDAGWVFAGPGSPSYTLRVLHGSGVPELLADKLDGAARPCRGGDGGDGDARSGGDRGGAVVFSSAAALTIGVATVPVYEIYKAGEEPHWEPGLGLIAAAGLNAAVIPHYDNAEGGHHDTRFCYLGERRLAVMERELPDGAFVLGVDEHTGLLLDLDADEATIVGLGGVTVRVAGESVVFPAGTTMTIDALRAAGRGDVGATATYASGGTAAPASVAAQVDVTVDTVAAASRTPLLDEAHRLEATFRAALRERDVATATGSVLELEETLAAWRGDNAATDEPDRARAVLRSMLVELGRVAVGGARDPREVVGPLVDVALAQRAEARARKDFAASDAVRDGLAAAGIEVRDTADGQVWELR